MRLLTTVILAAGLAATSAAAKPPLRDIAEIDDTIMVVAIADEIRKSCDDISPRLMRAYSTLSGLKALAREKGYSEEEVEDYVTSKSEKARMRAKAESFLAAQGVAVDDKAALCRFGKAQIQSQTKIGQLLK
ncbi:DUF5333 domain-containing protein [Marivita hallyeonensis]|uniref:DUF5333 domain-containing protein n=1 Tax=Marivita hallyeonensis TaxID=996342 RepID=A0A1M5RHV8_9RHOB|nr:DUF5333 domain-containing protein [Marivita hallyeonensis]SHH25905.1 hypothetical protein SAMN05443551_1769 [Marivita hallyeonensis]